jgi:protein involved in polysaccharide export with SLBB domain
MDRKTLCFLLISLFFLLGASPQVSGENSSLASQSLSETPASPLIFSPLPLYPVESKKTPEPAIPNQTPFSIDHLSAIEKIFNSFEKTKMFEEELQKVYPLLEQSKKPEISEQTRLQVSLLFDQIRQLDVLRQFGYDFFSLNPSTFAPVTDLPAGPDYLLGPGDELVIQIWGMLNGDSRIEIENNGEIFLPKIGRIPLAGKTLAEATDIIKKNIGQYYKDFQVSVTLGKLRTIKIFVAGEIKRPGGYDVSSFSTLLNALYFTGGPTRTGSLRNIKLVRDGKTFGYFDLYRFLLSGDKNQDYRLQSGDVVFVEPIGKVAAVWGNQVKRPGIYEISEETTLKELVTMAGGLLNLGATPQIKIESLGGYPIGKIPEILSLEKDYSLQGGETISISSDIISAKKQKTVMVEGEVINPGTYVIENEEKISSLLTKAGGFTSEAFLPGAVFTRKSVQEKQQENMNHSIVIQTQMLINEALQSGGNLSPGGGLDMNAVRKEQETLNLLVAKMSLGRIALSLGPPEKLQGTPNDLALEDGDRLFVPKSPFTISVVGAVNNQGAIFFEPSRDLAWYIEKAGGYAKYSDQKNIFIIHANGMAETYFARLQKVRQGDTLIVPEEVKMNRWAMTKDVIRMFYDLALPVAAFFK